MPCRLPAELFKIVAPMLEIHESKRRFPYDDTTGKAPATPTGGKVTIGIGRNLTDRGLSEPEILYLFNNDLDLAYNEARRAVGTDVFDRLTVRRKAVLVDMAFNLGYPKLVGFHNTLQAVKDGRYNDAATGMRNSLWAKQVGRRAATLAAMMEQG